VFDAASACCLLFTTLLPNQAAQVPRVPYSLFHRSGDDGDVNGPSITQDQIRYELANAPREAPRCWPTTPISTWNLPSAWSRRALKFAAAPTKRPNFFTTLLTLGGAAADLHPGCCKFLRARQMGGGGAQGALSSPTHPRPGSTCPMRSRASPSPMWPVWMRPKAELAEIVDFLKKPEVYTAIGARIPKRGAAGGPPAQARRLLSKAWPVRPEVPSSCIRARISSNSCRRRRARVRRPVSSKPRKKRPSSSFIDGTRCDRQIPFRSMGRGRRQRRARADPHHCSPKMDGFAPQTNR